MVIIPLDIAQSVSRKFKLSTTGCLNLSDTTIEFIQYMTDKLYDTKIETLLNKKEETKRLLVSFPDGLTKVYTEGYTVEEVYFANLTEIPEGRDIYKASCYFHTNSDRISALREPEVIQYWNTLISDTCEKLRIYPKLIRNGNGAYTFGAVVWELLGLGTKPYYTKFQVLMGILTNKLTLTQEIHNKINEISERHKEREIMETKEHTLTFEELYKDFKEELTTQSMYNSKLEENYRNTLRELVLRMVYQMNTLISTEGDIVESIPERYLRNILIPEAVSFFSHKKPASNKYRETKLAFEDRYLKKVIENNYELRDIPRILEDMQKGYVYVINSVRYKYVPSHLSNQIVYQNQYVDSHGVHYTEQEMTDIILKARYSSKGDKETKNIDDTINNKLVREILKNSNDLLLAINNKVDKLLNSKHECSCKSKNKEITKEEITNQEINKISISVDKDDLDIVEEYLKDKEELRNRQFEKKLADNFDNCYVTISKELVEKLNNRYGDILTGIKIRVKYVETPEQNTNNSKNYRELYQVWIPNIDNLIFDLTEFFRLQKSNPIWVLHTDNKEFFIVSLTEAVIRVLLLNDIPDSYLQSVM